MPVNSGIIFAGGMVAGGLAGYLVARAMYKKEIERLNQEIDDIADKAYKDWCRDNGKKATKEVSEEGNKKLSDAEQRAYMERMHLDRYSGTLYETEDIEGPIEASDKPYIITYDEFANEHIADFEKNTLTYYEKDDVLVNDEMELLNIDYYIGRENLDHVGEEEKDALFIRNEKNCVDYEVLVTHEKFREPEHVEVEGGVK